MALGMEPVAEQHRSPEVVGGIVRRYALGAAIIAALTLFAATVWPTLYRFEKSTYSGNTYLVRVNRLSGFTELLLGTRWIPEESSRRPVATQPLPEAELKKISGNAQIDKILRTFKGRIYNGSEWTVSELTVNVTALTLSPPPKKSGEWVPVYATAWARKFRIPDLDVPPLEVREFSVKVTGAEEAAETEWKIIAARGHR